MKGLFAWEPGCFISGHQNLDVAVEFISFQSSSKQTHSANYSNYLTFVHMSFVEIAVNAIFLNWLTTSSYSIILTRIQELCFPSLNSSRLMHSSMSRYMPCLITKLLCGSCSSVNDYFVVEHCDFSKNYIYGSSFSLRCVQTHSSNN